MKRLLLAATCLAAAPALALETPKPCSAADQRIRCIAYNPADIVQLLGTAGGALTVEFSAEETIVNASASDNGLMEGEGASARRGVLIATDSSPTADRNLQMARQANFLFLKPLGPLQPQPITVLTRREDGKMRRYTFQLETRAGAMTPDQASAFYAVRFSYPTDEAAARRARWAAQRETQLAQVAAARLRQNTLAGETVRNARYQGQATPEARTALAPTSTGREPAIWDDGQRTFLRYPGNRRVPMVYQVLADGRESLVGQSADADPTTGGTLVTLHGVFPSLKIRDGRAVLCIVNLGWDGGRGRNPGTGTTSPDVIRELAPEEQRHVR